MLTHDESTLEFFTRPAVMTAAGPHAALLENLPREIPALAAIAQGLLIHEHMAHAYGVTLSDADRASVHSRRVEELLAQIVARDDRPLRLARPPDGRLPGNCRHFTVLMVAMLRAQGTPARARCGFGGYFNEGFFEDHWVCEYWNANRERWILVDAQIDDPQRGWFGIDFDVTDVPRDRFLVAGEAWARYRSGAADPAKFGLSLVNEAGDWWIAGNLMRDAAALLNIELLPWDGWGAMPGADEPIDDDLAALFDKLAALTQVPDAAFAHLKQLCEDERLRVPDAVHNYLRDRIEVL
jgi:hypothetical protein